MPGVEHQVAMLDQLCPSWTTFGASSFPPSSKSSSPPARRGPWARSPRAVPQPAGETRGMVLPEAAGGLRRWDALSLGKVRAEPWLVLVENSLGAMLRLQICFGFGDLMMVIAWGGSSGQGDSSSA